jgi:DHA2 family multidrug resistance protein-like MFS transporter
MAAAANASGDLQGLDGSRRQWAAVSVGLATVMAVLDGTMINVALPGLSKALAVTPAAAIWVINAYQLAIALVLLPLGRLGDIYGRRPAYFACLSVFTVASVGCAASDSLTSLAFWRFFQGCGGAGMMGITNAMLRFIYPPRLLPRGMSINTFVVTGALALGPSIASAIMVFAGWRWLFIVNIPVCALCLAAGWRSLPEGRRVPHKFDTVGAGLSMASFGLVIAAINAVAHGAQPYLTAALTVLGISVSMWMIRHQSRIVTPIFPVDLLKMRPFGISILTMIGAAAAQTIAYVAIPFLLHTDLGRSQLEIGAMFLPWPFGQACAAFAVSILASRVGPGMLSGCGLLIFAVGLGAIATVPAHASTLDILWRMALCGAGWGAFQPPNSRAIVTSVAPERAGSASVMGAAGRVTGQALGAAFVACLFRLLAADARYVALWSAAGIALLAAAASFGRGMNDNIPVRHDKKR